MFTFTVKGSAHACSCTWAKRLRCAGPIRDRTRILPLVRQGDLRLCCYCSFLNKRRKRQFSWKYQTQKTWWRLLLEVSSLSSDPSMSVQFEGRSSRRRFGSCEARAVREQSVCLTYPINLSVTGAADQILFVLLILYKLRLRFNDCWLPPSSYGHIVPMTTTDD